jgi:Cys-Gly metallodipeptidase DUG1
VFKVQPDYTREGGSIPVTLTFQDALSKSVLLLPMGKSDDGAHSTNEKIVCFWDYRLLRYEPICGY